jgi:predicted Na+-dependent transporter
VGRLWRPGSLKEKECEVERDWRIKMRKYFDPASIVVILVTLVLFITALFYKGFTHDLLLEAGVFLVSVKLILLSFRNSVFISDLKKELREIKELIKNQKVNDN